MRLSAVIIAIAALGVAAPAWAQAPDDAPVSTASATSSSPITTATQIEQYLASSPAYGAPMDDLGEPGPRRIHGEVDLSVGTGGYRSGHVSAVIPIGERGTLGLSYGQTKFGDSAGYGYGYGDPAYGYGYDGRGYSPMSFDASRGATADRTDCVSDRRGGAGYGDMSQLDRARVAGGRCPLR